MKTYPRWIVRSASDEKLRGALPLQQGGSGIPCTMGNKTRVQRASFRNGASRAGYASRIEFAIHLAVFTLALCLPLCVSASEPHLGWIPVQQIKPGSEFILDMHRFFQQEDGAKVQVSGTSGTFTARFEPGSLQLSLQIKPDAAGLLDVPFEIPGTSLKGVLTLAVQKRPSHLFSYKPDKPISTVTVAGSFNGWSKDKNPMSGPDSTGLYSARVEIEPGIYQYKFVVTGEWTADPASQEKASDNFGNSVVKIESSGSSAPFIFADRLDGGELGVSLVPGGSPVTRVSAVAELPDGTSSSCTSKIEGSKVIVSTADLPKTSWVRVIVADGNGNTSNVIRVPLDSSTAFRWQDAVMYYTFTDRFSDGDKSNDKPLNDPNVKWPANYHGGDWRGIRQKIEEGYFDALGVNTIWLAPLNKNPDKAWQESPEPHRWYT
ncbi:MAG: hypothetical protein WCH43_17290, partial [Verrucomicrobiota bacterium]